MSSEVVRHMIGVASRQSCTYGADLKTRKEEKKEKKKREKEVRKKFYKLTIQLK